MEGWVLKLDRDGRPLGEWPLSEVAIVARLVDPATGREVVVLTLAAPDDLPAPAGEVTRILRVPGQLVERATIPLPPEALVRSEDAGTERRVPVPPTTACEDVVTAASRRTEGLEVRNPGPHGVDEVPWTGGRPSDDDVALPPLDEDGSPGR